MDEASLTLFHTIAQNASVHSSPTYVAFVDFTTAFPSTCRPALWVIMHKKGIIGRIWRNIQRMYDDPRGRMIHPLIQNYESFSFFTGLMEGSRLSPVLYAYMVDSLIEELQTKFAHCSIQANTHHQLWTGAVVYADDLTLESTSFPTLQLMFDTTSEWSKKNFAPINADKTKLMAFKEAPLQKFQRCDRNQGTLFLHDTSKQLVLSTAIEEVANFTYLGTHLGQ